MYYAVECVPLRGRIIGRFAAYTGPRLRAGTHGKSTLRQTKSPKK